MKRWIGVILTIAALFGMTALGEGGRTVFVNPQGGKTVHAQRDCEDVPETDWPGMTELSAERFAGSDYSGYALCDTCFGELTRVTSLPTVGQWGDVGVFYPLWQPEGEDWREREAAERYADVTHDGLADRIVLCVYPDEAGRSPEEVMDGAGMAFVRVFPGMEDGSFAETPLFISRGYAGTHAGNGTLLLARRAGQTVLIDCDFYETQGTGMYHYAVYWLRADVGISLVEERRAEFRLAEGEPEAASSLPLRGEVIPAFLEQLSSWTGNAEVLLHAHAEMQPIVADWESNRPASEVLDTVAGWDW